MREQFRSNTMKKGEPLSHVICVWRVTQFINLFWDKIFDGLPIVHAPLKLKFTDEFIKENKWKKHPIHSYDIGCTIGKQPKLIVEIGNVGDDSKHNLAHKDQMINDGIAKKFVEEYYPSCKFVRLNKEDCNYPDWLRRRLFK